MQVHNNNNNKQWTNILKFLQLLQKSTSTAWNPFLCLHVSEKTGEDHVVFERPKVSIQFTRGLYHNLYLSYLPTYLASKVCKRLLDIQNRQRVLLCTYRGSSKKTFLTRMHCDIRTKKKHTYIKQCQERIQKVNLTKLVEYFFVRCQRQSVTKTCSNVERHDVNTTASSHAQTTMQCFMYNYTELGYDIIGFDIDR